VTSSEQSRAHGLRARRPPSQSALQEPSPGPTKRLGSIGDYFAEVLLLD
jgi:hypothetical protein